MNNRKYFFSGNQVSPIIDGMIGKVNELIDDQKLEQIKSNFISSDIAYKKSQSIEQIRAVVPKRPIKTRQDNRPFPVKTQAIRPFSAKVKKNCIKSEMHYHPRKNSIMKGMISMRSMKSLKTQTQKVVVQNESLNKFVPLLNNDEDTGDDQFIQKLRVNKLLAQEYEVKKQKFLETISKENETYSQNQLKFISSMGKKDYTYNYGGSIVETKSKGNKNKKLRKVTYLKSTTRNSDVVEEKDQTMMITYRKMEEKENNFCKEWEMDEEENMHGILSYKSQNGKYMIK